MNILIINFEYPPLGGGGGVATRQIAEQLAKRHRVTVLTTHLGDLKRYERQGNLEIVRVRVLRRRSQPTASLMSLITFVPAALLRAWGLKEENDFTVINAQFVIPSGLVGAILAVYWRVPLVVSFIGGDLFDPSKGTSPHRHGWLRALIRWISRRATKLTAISEDTARHARELHGVSGSIDVIHLGIEPVVAERRSRQELGLPLKGSIMISIGRLIPRKNYTGLMAAWNQVPDGNLVILGSGPLENKLRRLIEKYGLQERVQLRGFVTEKEKQEILRASDGYVAATDHEGFGIVFLEAMQAGLPIVATDRGGQTDFLRDGENALLVPQGQPMQLAAAVRKLFADQELAQRLRANNRKKVKNFYLQKTVADFERILISAAEYHARSN